MSDNGKKYLASFTTKSLMDAAMADTAHQAKDRAEDREIARSAERFAKWAVWIAILALVVSVITLAATIFPLVHGSESGTQNPNVTPMTAHAAPERKPDATPAVPNAPTVK